MMNTHIKNIDYKSSLITFLIPSQRCCELIADSEITLKGFLKEDITILPHSEQEFFIKTEAILDQTQFQLKGLVFLTAEKERYRT